MVRRRATFNTLLEMPSVRTPPAKRVWYSFWSFNTLLEMPNPLGALGPMLGALAFQYSIRDAVDLAERPESAPAPSAFNTLLEMHPKPSRCKPARVCNLSILY